jgi:hypothetical protein
MTDDVWRKLVDEATQRYRASGKFGYHFARGKLTRDPVFAHLVASGLLHTPGRGQTAQAPLRLLDIGSGQSLLASLLHHMTVQHDAGRWPSAWPTPARDVAYTGIELMPKDIERARAALADLPRKPTLLCADMTQAAFPASDVVVILDVLHYVEIAAQDALLARVHASLREGRTEGRTDGRLDGRPDGARGRLLLRVGDQASSRGFAASQWVDRVVTSLRGHRIPPTYGRPLAAWMDALRHLGFTVRAVPKSEGTPFANVLLIAEVA